MTENRMSIPPRNAKPSKTEQHRADEREFWGQQLRMGRTLNRVTACAAAVGLLGLVILYCTLKSGEDATIIANRGWIAPLRLSIVSGVDDPEGPSVMVHYQNSGKSPALDVKIGMAPVAVDVKGPARPTREYPKTPLWDALGKTFRETCNQNKPVSGMGAVFPSATTESNAPSNMTTAWDKEKLLNGTQIIVVAACFTYRTMEIVGHSGFCNYVFHIAGRPPQSWEIRACPVANYAE